MTLLVVAVVLLWVIVMILAVLVVLLYRQFGLIYIGSRARVALTGLAVGATAPEVAHLRMAGRDFDWSWNAGQEGRATFAIFGAPACTLCAKLTPHINSFADRWGHVIDVIFVERGPLPAGPTHDSPTRTQWMYAEDPEGILHDKFDIENTPYAFVVDSKRRVLSKGIVNDRKGLEGVLSFAMTEEGTLLPEPPTETPVRREEMNGRAAVMQASTGMEP